MSVDTVVAAGLLGTKGKRWHPEVRHCLCPFLQEGFLRSFVSLVAYLGVEGVSVYHLWEQTELLVAALQGPHMPLVQAEISWGVALPEKRRMCTVAQRRLCGGILKTTSRVDDLLGGHTTDTQSHGYNLLQN